MAEIDLSPEERVRIEELYDLAMTGTYYDVLGVGSEADGKAVQRIYYELSRTWHPDRFFRREMGLYRERLEMIFAALTKAYKTLYDDADRARYNRELEERGVKLGPSRRGPARVQPAAPPPVVPQPAAVPEMAVHEVEFRRPTTSVDPSLRSVPPQSFSPGPPSVEPTGSVPPGPRLAVRRPESKVVTAMRDQVRDRLERARRFHATGLEDYAAGRFLKAAGSFQLACEFDPKNETYRKLHEDAQVKAQAAHLEQLLGLAKKADENMQEAACIHYLKQAIPLEPSDGAVYFRVARWMRDKDNDPRGALQLLRKAVERKPDKLEYRMALADLYATLKMELNAKREYQAILDRDKKHEGAKKAMAALKV